MAIDDVLNDDSLFDLANCLGRRAVLHPHARNESMQIPEFPDIDFTNWSVVSETWPTVDYDLFPRWRPTDIPVMICIGFLGGLLSYGLHDKFEALHKAWTNLPYEQGGHAAEIVDKIPGKMHRFKYGHDILNPFEVDWDNYFPDGVEASFMKKLAAWLHHLFQDTFSTEGLPLPGSSYFKDVIDKLTSGISVLPDMDKYQAYKTFFTVKARDITGSMFVASAMTLYIWGTEAGNDKKFFNYRYTSLTLGALLVSIVTGLCMPIKKASFNHSAVTAMVPYAFTLAKVNKRLNDQLKLRDLSIATNNNALEAQRQYLDGARANLTSINSKLVSFYIDLNSTLNDLSQLLDDRYNRCSDLLISQNVWLNSLAMTLEEEE